MGEQDIAMHYVCTKEEAWQFVKDRSEFWVSNCGCREQRGACARSRIDVCLFFQQGSYSDGSGTKKISFDEVEKIFQEAKERHLVTRPFRNKDRTETDGICFCCDDCCGYFLDPNEKCNKGKFVETTDNEVCTDCAVCVDVCYFKAREMVNDELVIKRDNCYGCGLCKDMCPENCIEVVKRS